MPKLYSELSPTSLPTVKFHSSSPNAYHDGPLLTTVIPFYFFNNPTITVASASWNQPLLGSSHWDAANYRSYTSGKTWAQLVFTPPPPTPHLISTWRHPRAACSFTRPGLHPSPQLLVKQALPKLFLQPRAIWWMTPAATDSSLCLNWMGGPTHEALPDPMAIREMKKLICQPPLQLRGAVGRCN